MKKLILFFSALLLLATACKKDPANFTGYENVIASVDSYQPLLKGSYWVYAATSGSSTDTIIKTINGNTLNINGNTYYEASVVSAVNGTSKEYYYYDGHSYYTRTVDALLSAQPVNFYYLVDTARKNTGWSGRLTNNGMVEGREVIQVGLMKNNDTTRNVLGKDYSKVVSTAVTVSAKLDDGSYAALYTYNNYMVKGIGTIQTDIQQGSRLIGSISLVRYFIPELPAN